MKKYILMFFIAVVLVTSTTTVNVAAQDKLHMIETQTFIKQSWKKSNGKWWWQNSDGSYPRNSWEKINGVWYYFDSGGYMVTGWRKVKGEYYYLKPSGAMATGWQKVSGDWYYLESSGAMTTGWQKISGEWYYMDSDGVMCANQWVGKYYVQSDGSMAVNKWIGKYHVGADGKRDKTKTYDVKIKVEEKSAQPTSKPKEPTLKEGNAGIAQIPSINYSVPLYSGANSQSWQSIVDKEDSALLVPFMGKLMFADHASQGLKAVGSCKAGDVMYITKNGVATKYKLTTKYTNGQNVGNGILINGVYADEMDDGDLFMYYCNDAYAKNVTVIFWKRQ